MRDSFSQWAITIRDSPRVLLKPDVMYHPARGKPFMKPGITVREDTLSAVVTFIYVAGVLSRQVDTDEEVNHSIARTCSAFST